MTHEPSLDVERIDRYRQWRAAVNPSGGVWQYLGAQFDIDQAALFSTLFVPTFVEVRGCTLLAARYEAASFDRWWQALQGDRAAVERVMNHTHLYDVFPRATTEDLTLAMYEAVAHALVICWEGALRRAFPAESFEFSYATEPEEYGPTITFWHAR